MIVIITDEAEADLERIGDYIAADNPRRAETFVRELTDRCYHLASMPNAYPVMPHHEHTGIRRRPYGEYLIFYRIDAEAVIVLHVLNGAQDYESLLFAGD